MRVFNLQSRDPDRRLAEWSSPLAVLVAVGVVLAGCQPPAEEGMEAETTARDTAGAEVSSRVVEMERSLWESLSQGDYQGFSEHIADDATMVGSEGFTTKQEMMGMLEGGTLESYEVGDFQVMQPGSNVAVVTYRYSETFRPAEADSAMDFAGWATTMWENRNGTWVAVFHQASEEPPSTQ